MVGGINSIEKRYIYQLISSVKLPGSRTFDSHILMDYNTQNDDVNLAKEFKKHQFMVHQKYGAIDQSKYRKMPVKENGYTDSIM